MGLTGVPAPCFTWPTGKLSLCNMYVCVFFSEVIRLTVYGLKLGRKTMSSDVAKPKLVLK